MRESEILGLTWPCVDFDKGTILVRRQLQKVDGVYSLVPLKNDKERTIKPGNYVMGILKAQQNRQRQMRLQAGAAWAIGMDLVFTNEFGAHLVQLTVYKNAKDILRSIGMPDSRFHDLRHSYATVTLQNGDDIKTVSSNLGHATVAFTLDVYGHVSDKMKQDSADRMDRFIQGL